MSRERPMPREIASIAERPESVLSPSPDVVARDIAGENLLVPVRAGAAEIDSLYTADGAGAFIWSCLDGKRDLRAVARMVEAEFEVDAERALEDVIGFATALRRAGLALAVEVAP